MAAAHFDFEVEMHQKLMNDKKRKKSTLRKGFDGSGRYMIYNQFQTNKKVDSG